MLSNERSQLVRFLRWSEAYTKTDMVYLARGGFWSVVGQVVAALSALAVSIAFARWIPKEVYGNYRFILSIVGVLSIFSLGNLGTAVAQSAARGYDRALSEGFRISLRWSILIFAGAFALCAYYLFSGNILLATGILIGGFATPFLNSANLAGPFLNGKQDFARATLYFGIVGVVLPAVALISTLFFTKNLFVIVGVYFLSNLAVDLALYFRTAEKFKVRSGKFDTEMLLYGKHLSTMAIVGGVAGSIDQLLLFHYVGAVDLAVYAFSIGILDQIKGPAKTIDKMMQARFSNRASEHIEENIENKMFWMLIAGISGIVVFSAFAWEIYHLLFPAYLDAVPYARLYSLTLLGLATVPIGSYFSAHKRLWEQYIINISASSIQIVSMVAGVIYGGLLGLIIARVFSSAVTSLIMLGLYYSVRD